MSAAIGSELHHFLNCLWYGVVLFGVYDVLRIFRELIRHGSWLISLEDIVFWIWAAFYLFSHFFVDTYGAVRGYQLLGVGTGGTIWEYGCGRFLTKKMIFYIRWLKFRARRCKILMYMRSLMPWEKRMRENNREKSRVDNQKRSQNKKGAAKRKRNSKARKNRIQNKVAIKSITMVVCLLLVVLLLHGRSLHEQVKANEVKISQLQDAYEKEQARTKEIEDLQEYMQSEEFAEKYAKEKIGLLKENEILFKENK